MTLKGGMEFHKEGRAVGHSKQKGRALDMENAGNIGEIGKEVALTNWKHKRLKM